MLEKACLAVEKAATGGGVYPEVMFEVARHWYHLFEKHAPAASNDSTEDDQPLQPDHVIIFILHCSILRMLLAQPNIRLIKSFCARVVELLVLEGTEAVSTITYWCMIHLRRGRFVLS